MKKRNGTQTPSLLGQLRRLSPSEQLDLVTARLVSSDQAELLAQRLAASHGPLATRLEALLPCLQVRHDSDLPSYGSAHWTGMCWLVVLCASDKPTVRDYVLLHLIKHIIDHGNAAPATTIGRSSSARHAIAEHFASEVCRRLEIGT